MFTGGKVVPSARITIDGGVIVSVEPVTGAESESLLVPGFVDVHVHGGDGSDFMDGTEEAAGRIAAMHAREGTTALAATTLSASRGDVSAAIRAARGIAEVPSRGAAIVALHLEGPYIDPARAGAQSRDAIRRPDETELSEWISLAGSLPIIMTIAPNVDGAIELIRKFSDRVIFSIGHTGATFAEASAAIDAGARHATHLFNAMSGLGHREPGATGAVLSQPHVYAELIADGHHLHPVVLRIAAQQMAGRAVLITDAMRACGMAEGTYKLYDYDVSVADGAARLADGTLAGSVLTMAGAVCNMVELASLPLESVVPMASEVPARLLNLSDRGTITPGKRADIVQLDDRMRVRRVWIGGEEIS